MSTKAISYGNQYSFIFSSTFRLCSTAYPNLHFIFKCKMCNFQPIKKYGFRYVHPSNIYQVFCMGITIFHILICFISLIENLQVWDPYLKAECMLFGKLGKCHHLKNQTFSFTFHAN